MLKYEVSDIKKMYKMQKVNFPISVYLKITTECMLKCDFCSQAGRKNNYMELDKIKDILNQLKALGIIYIYYTGGEPLMHKDIGEILRYGYKLGFKQFLVSNGILFTKRKNIELTKYLIGLGISIHGKPETHNNVVGNINCFEQIIKNLKNVQEENQNIEININCTATEQNISKENFEYLAKICKNNKWKLTIARLNYIGDGIKHNKIDLNNMLNIITELNNEEYEINISNCIAPCTVNKKYIYLTHGCGAGQTIAAIESNGDMKICASSNMSIGNLYKSSFKKIWRSYTLRKYKKFNWLLKQCKVCKYFLICKGGCKAELTGKYWKDFCDATVQQEIDKEWNIMKDNILNLSFEYIRKESRNRYIIAGAQTRVCNSSTKDIILQIDGKKTGNDIIRNNKNNQNEVQQLLVAMKRDRLIEVRK